jgi:exonuclease VII small subunit
MSADVDELIERLERSAERLRTDDLPLADAARMIEECAELAAQASTELERRARGEQLAALSGQQPLTGPRQDSLL